MKKSFKLLTLLFVSIMVFTIASFFGKADASTYDINSTTLYNATNTYNYSFSSSDLNKINEENNLFRANVSSRYNERYNMSYSNSNKVITFKPQITVFTHGWTGHASTWDDKFDEKSRDDNSLVQQLYNKNNKSTVYLAKFKSKTEFGLFDVTSYFKNQSAIPNFSDDSSEYDNSFNAIKNNVHNIIVFDGYKTGYSNDYIYNQFNYMLSCVVLQVKELNGGLLPKINLIGHSRGGLTNMQYALDHPSLVNQMYSYDTPYLGTTTANLLTRGSKISGVATELGAAIAGSYTGMLDLTDPSAYLSLMNRWNNNYSRYSHISVKTFAGVTTILDSADNVATRLLGFLKTFDPFISFMNTLSEKFSFGEGAILGAVCDKILEEISNALLRLTIAGGTIVLAGLVTLTAVTATVIIEALRPILVPLIKAEMATIDAGDNWYKFILEPWATIEAHARLTEIELSIADFFADLTKLVLTEFRVKVLSNGSYKVIWDNDFCVNLDSQLAKKGDVSYRGFSNQQSNVNDYNLLDSGITHIAVLHDSSLHNKVLSTISINDKNFDLKSIKEIDLSSTCDYKYSTNLTISGKNANLYKFTPKVSGWYTFETLGSVDTYMYIYDSKGDIIKENDDDGIGTNSKITISFTGGFTYYISIRGYSDYTTGKSELIVSEDPTNLSNADIWVGLDGKFINLYKFIPNESTTYTFETLGDKDTYMYLYDSNKDEITHNDDQVGNRNAKIEYDLVNGNTYYIGVRAWSEYTSGYTELTYSKPVVELASGTNYVNNNSRYTYTATEKVLVSIETTDNIDTKFTNIVSSNSDYGYYDDTYIDDNDGGEYFYDASLYVVLEAGQSISFTVSSNYENPSKVNIKVDEYFLDRKPEVVEVVVPQIYEGNNNVDNNTNYTFTAQRDGIYVIETTDDIDTMFNNIISDDSDYGYYDDTYIDDNDGGETFYDASLYVHLRAGESVSFTVSTNYYNPNKVNIHIYTL